MIDKRYTWRMAVLSVMIMTALAGLGVRLAFLHLGDNADIRERVFKRRHLEREIKVGRGRILDRNGDILAMDLPMKNVCASPVKVMEEGYVKFIGDHLARLLQIEPAYVYSRLTREGRHFEYIKKNVHADTAEKISMLKLPGVFFRDVSQRHYPHSNLCSHVLGFVNAEGQGSAGIEQKRHSLLKGRPGLMISEKDGRRREVYSRRNLEIEPEPGADVYLTIDQHLQDIVEEYLEQALHEHHALGAWAIVQRVHTGEILAMANKPDYNPNAYNEVSPAAWKNRAVSHVYEPGSTFKIAVVAAALDAGLVTEDQVFDTENGMWHYGGRPLRDYHGYDKLSVADIIRKSSNIGAAKIALELGPERLTAALKKFGVGQKSGIDLPGEEHGIFHPVDKWSKISITRISMGHEVGVTALQMVNMMSAIANDGFLLRPYIVERAVDHDGTVLYEVEPEVMSRPISEETSVLMRRLLTRVTGPGGTARRARVEGYSVGGKTGTAQKPIPGKGYSDSAHMASFTGFLPAEDPELAIIVVVDEPQPLHTGGAVAAPVFAKIAEEAVRLLDVPPPEFAERTRISPFNQYVIE